MVTSWPIIAAQRSLTSHDKLMPSRWAISSASERFMLSSNGPSGWKSPTAVSWELARRSASRRPTPIIDPKTPTNVTLSHDVADGSLEATLGHALDRARIVRPRPVVPAGGLQRNQNRRDPVARRRD